MPSHVEPLRPVEPLPGGQVADVACQNREEVPDTLCYTRTMVSSQSFADSGISYGGPSLAVNGVYATLGTSPPTCTAGTCSF